MQDGRKYVKARELHCKMSSTKNCLYKLKLRGCFVESKEADGDGDGKYNSRSRMSVMATRTVGRKEGCDKTSSEKIWKRPRE